MKKLLLLPLISLCALNIQAVRQPMEGRFDIYKALKALHGARLDSIRTMGEWGGWVDDEHDKIAKRFLEDIQEIIDESRTLQINPIYGDGESNFLVNLK